MYQVRVLLLLFVVSNSSEIKHFLFEQEEDSLPLTRLGKHGVHDKRNRLKQRMENLALFSEPETADERKLVHGLMMLNRLTKMNPDNRRHVSKDLMNRIVGDSHAVALSSLLNVLGKRLRMIRIWVSVRTTSYE